MAVTITVAELAAALRLGTTSEETAQVTRLLAYSTEAVTRHAPDAPDVAHNEAVVRLAGYLFDQPYAGRGIGFAHALRNSGAAAMLLPYRAHRAGATAADAAPEGMTGSAGNPVTNVTVSGATLTVHYADGSTATRTLPTGGTGGPAVDQTARDDAAAAQATADAATAAAAEAANPPTASDAEATAGTETALRSWSAALIRRLVNAVLPVQPTDSEADAGTSATSRLWSASKIARTVRGVVPAWARATNPPDPDVLHVSAADTFEGNNLIRLNNVPASERGRRYGFFVERANTGAVEIAGAADTAQPLVTNTGDALTGGELVVGEFIEIVDDGTSFRIVAGSATGHFPALARNEDVDDSETDLSRVPTVEKAIRLVRRLLGENVRSIPEPEASHTGRPLVATSTSNPYAAWQRLGTDGYDDGSVTEAKLDTGVRTKLNASRGGGRAFGSGSGEIAAWAEGDDTDTIPAAKIPAPEDTTARAAAAAAQLDVDTVIEVGPPFVHNETGPKNLSINIRHPLNAYSAANVMEVSVAGQPVVVVGYDNTLLHQDTLAGVSAVALQNIWAQTDSIPDGQGGTRRVQRWALGSYIPVEVTLRAGRGGTAHFSRVVDVLVEAASGGAAGVPDAPANTATQTDYVLRRPATTGAATWAEAPAGGTTRTQIGGTTTFTETRRVSLSTTDAAALITAWNSGTYSRLLLEFGRTSDAYAQAEIWITGNVANGNSRRHGFTVAFPIHTPDEPAEASLDMDRRRETDAVTIAAFDNPFASGTTLTIWGVT